MLLVDSSEHLYLLQVLSLATDGYIYKFFDLGTKIIGLGKFKSVNPIWVKACEKIFGKRIELYNEEDFIRKVMKKFGISNYHIVKGDVGVEKVIILDNKKKKESVKKYLEKFLITVE